MPDFRGMRGITWVMKSSKTSPVGRGQSLRARWTLVGRTSLTQPLLLQCCCMGFLKVLEKRTINWGLRTIGMHSLTVLVGGNPKGVGWQGSILSGGDRRESVSLHVSASRGHLYVLAHGLILPCQSQSVMPYFSVSLGRWPLSSHLLS